MITVFDMLDMALVAAVIVVAWAKQAKWALWAVASLLLYHVVGRWIAWHVAEPLPELALAQFAVALGYLFGPILSNYGRIVGSLFVVMSLSSLGGVIAGATPRLAGGLALDLWNVQSLCLHGIAITIVIGVLRHDYLGHTRVHGARRR